MMEYAGKTIGFLGGTFDPPHYGHLMLAKTVLQECRVDAVMLVPSCRPPHKDRQDISPAENRLDMAKLLVAGEHKIFVSDIELHMDGKSFTIDTFHLLHDKYPQTTFRLIIGADMALDFASWRRSEELARIARPFVAERPGSPLPRDLAVEIPDGMVKETAEILQQGRFPFEPVDISSTAIRDFLLKGQCVSGMTAPEVADYYLENILHKGSIG